MSADSLMLRQVELLAHFKNGMSIEAWRATTWGREYDLIIAEHERRFDIKIAKMEAEMERKAARKAKILAAGGTWHEQKLDNSTNVS
jgi:hypothetical protein